MTCDDEILQTAKENLRIINEKRTELNKYFLLEKLLLALNKLKTNNASYFSSNDTKNLVNLYKNDNRNFVSSLRSRYIYHYEREGFTYDESNFYAMLRGASRNPNSALLQSLVEVILSGYFLEEDNAYSFIEPLENLSDDNAFLDSYRYLRFCYAISIIEKDDFQEYDIEYGNTLIDRLTSDDMPAITRMYNQPVLLSRYMHADLDNEDYFTDEHEILLSELYAPDMCELPHCSRESFDIFSELLSSKKCKFSERITLISNELLAWVCTYLWKYCSVQDNYFHRILFMLSFVSEDTLDKYITYVPDNNLNISSSSIDNYYSDIRKMLELPPIIDDYSYLSTPERDTNITYLNEAYESDTYPKWLLYSLCHLTDKQLLASKYLYITFILRKRYHKQRDNDSFPEILLELLKEDIADFSYLYKICS